MRQYVECGQVLLNVQIRVLHSLNSFIIFKPILAILTDIGDTWSISIYFQKNAPREQAVVFNWSSSTVSFHQA